jgi:hypothetical protein
MPRYSESREKFPVHIELQLTREQNRRALALAKHYRVSRPEAIRRSLDLHYLTIFSQSSTDQTDRSGEQA